MTRLEKLTAACVILFTVAGALGPAVLVKEFWPFSNYQLYSVHPKKMEFSMYSFYGLHDGEEIYLGGREKYFSPLFNMHLSKNFHQSHRNGNSSHIKGKLKAVFDWYEFRRRRELHDGPPLEGMRLYLVRWENDIEFRTIYSPQKLSLIAELYTDEQNSVAD